MAFTRTLNRTLVLPHWIEYPTRAATSVRWSSLLNAIFSCVLYLVQIQIPFDRYFQVEPLRTYLKVILMKDFMAHVAEQIWPHGKRFGRTRETRAETMPHDFDKYFVTVHKSARQTRRKVATLKMEIHSDRIGLIFKSISMVIFSISHCISIFERQTIGMPSNPKRTIESHTDANIV
jgi:hypothetical protein